MLKLGNQIRFTPAEIEEAKTLGIDLVGVKSQAEYSRAVMRLVSALEYERPDILEKIAVALAEKTGRKLPPKLSVVPSPR